LRGGAIALIAAVSLTACTESLAGDLVIDLDPTVFVCVPDQTTSGVEGTAFLLPLALPYRGDWTIDAVRLGSEDGLAASHAWVLEDPGETGVLGYGFPLPPDLEGSSAGDLESWRGRQDVPGAHLTGSAAHYTVLLQLNLTGPDAAESTGFVVEYRDARGEPHTASSGATVRMEPYGNACSPRSTASSR
jgi:hypothetical protein